MSDGTQSRAEWVSSALENFEQRLLKYALGILGDVGRAQDVVQDTFLKLYQQDPQTLNGQLLPWLYTVCRHQALDLCRKENRMTTATADDELDVLELTQSREPAPLEQLEASEEMSAVLAHLARLPPSQQECLRLKFQHSLSYQEISSITGHTVSNVGYLIHVGLKTLRDRCRS